MTSAGRSVVAALGRRGVATAAVAALMGGTGYLGYLASRTLVVAGPGLLTPLGRPVGSDFVQYWSVSKLALDGAPAAAYDPAVLHAAERAALAADTMVVPWHYPPTFMLALLPLALAPYLVALAAWLGLSLAAYAVVLRRAADGVLALALGLLFPAVANNLASGQNGLLTAALLGAGLLLLERRPWLAGALLGALSYKPHIAVLVPIALAAGGHWRALAGAALCALGMAVASVAVLGLEPWAAFATDALGAAGATPARPHSWTRMPTLFIAARLAEATPAVAYLLQGAAAVAAVAAVVWAWRARLAPQLQGAVLAAAIPMATPYAFDYDLALLVLAFAWIARDARESGWLGGERVVLAAAWLAPASWVFFERWGQPAATAALALLLAVAVRRARRRAVVTPAPRTAG